MNNFKFLTIAILSLSLIPIYTARKSYSSFKVSNKSMSKKSYTPKSPYSGLGKPSSSNGRIKTTPVSGYFKPSNGYKRVNPYVRSK